MLQSIFSALGASSTRWLHQQEKKVSIHRQNFSPLGTSFIYFLNIYGKRRLVTKILLRLVKD